MAEPAFEQTGDLVRFRVHCSRAALPELHRLHDAEDRAGRHWVWFGGADVGDGLVFRSFFCSKESAPAVLDLLAKHGVERVGRLP